MPDYGKKTVAELQEILRSRSLPHSGKKAELVTRLNEADQSEATNTPADPVPTTPSAVPASQVTASTASNATAPAARVTEVETTSPHNLPLPETKNATAPANGEQFDTGNTANTAVDPTAAATDYSIGITASSYDDEIKKRQARLERFGGSATEMDAEAAKAAERAERFGTQPTSIRKLDEPLPLRTERRGKRGRDGDLALDDHSLRPRRAAKRQFRGRDGRDHRRGERPSGVQKSTSKPAGVFSTEKDRLAAEARKKKFAAV